MLRRCLRCWTLERPGSFVTTPERRNDAEVGKSPKFTSNCPALPSRVKLAVQPLQPLAADMGVDLC